MALTHRQRRFVQEYLRSETATEAALRSGYASKSAPVIASRMMNDPEILAAIDEGQKARLERVGVDADYLLKRLHEEIEADIADLYHEESGDLLPVHEWPEVWRRGLVAGVEIEALFEGRGEDRVQVGHVRKVRLSDRVRRIEVLGRHVSVNAFRENIRVEGLSGLADRLTRSLSRADRDDSLPSLTTIDAQPLVASVREPEPKLHAEMAQAPSLTAQDDWTPAPTPAPSDKPTQTASEQPASEREAPAPIGVAEIIGAHPPASYRLLPWPSDDDGPANCDYDPLS